jgi:hypothetical protein
MSVPKQALPAPMVEPDVAGGSNKDALLTGLAAGGISFVFLNLFLRPVTAAIAASGVGVYVFERLSSKSEKYSKLSGSYIHYNPQREFHQIRDSRNIKRNYPWSLYRMQYPYRAV